MRSAVIAYRLLQLKYCDVRAHSRASILAARRGPQPSSRVVRRGDPLALFKATAGPTGREPRAPKDPPRSRFFPVRGLATTV